MLTAFCSTDIGIEKTFHLLFDFFPNHFINAIANAGAFYAPLNDTCVFEFFQMLGNSSLCQTNFVYQIVANTSLLLDYVLQNGNTGWVRQSL